MTHGVSARDGFVIGFLALKGVPRRGPRHSVSRSGRLRPEEVRGSGRGGRGRGVRELAWIAAAGNDNLPGWRHPGEFDRGGAVMAEREADLTVVVR